MSIVNKLLIILLCGIVFFFAKPLFSSRNFSKPKKGKQTTSENSPRTTKKSPSGQTKPKEASPLPEESITENESDTNQATKLSETPKHNESSTHQPEDKDSDNSAASVEKKTAFPITSLQLDRSDNSASTGSLKLEEALDSAIKNNRFEALVNLLKNDLYQPLKKDPEIDPKELGKLIDTPAWNHTLNLYTVLQLFSPKDIKRITTAPPETQKFYYWLFTTPEALTQLLYNLKPEDNLHKALAIWHSIWKNETDEALRLKYLNLAIACALVYDKGTIKAKMAYNPVDPFERYSIFKKNAEAKRLKTVISNMTVSDLVWVVDVPLTNEEIEWAVRRANFSRRRWGKSYSHIEYLMERAVNGENPYTEYSLAQLEKHGGICGDQTYFSVNTAKANGIPASGIMGSGNRGAHAWMAYKPNKNEWNTSTGRYENYSNGTSRNAQINKNISEFDFMLMSDRKMKEAKVQEAKTILRFVTLLITMDHDPIGIRQTLEMSLRTAPLLEEAWAAHIAFLEQASPALTQAEWQKIIDTIERTFKKHPTMWMIARTLTQKHIWTHLEQDQIEKTQSRYRSEIARKFPARGDLIRKVVAEQGATVSQEKDFKKVRSFYRQVLRLYGKDTLNFKFIANQYFKTGKNFPENREQICNDIESYFSRSIDQESGDFFKAKTEIDMLKIIANYYGSIGNARKAKKYKKEAERRLIKSSKRAL